MKNPNGYGTIKRLSGNRRRPFVFAVTAGGRQKPVAYFADLVDAKIYQTDYNRTHGQDRLSDQKITFAELYHRWLPARIERHNPSDSAVAGYRAAYRHCEALYDMPLQDIRYPHLQKIIDSMKKSGLSYSSCKKVRSLISLLYKYARMMEYTDRSYSGLINIGKNKAVYPHKPFSRRQINRLWENPEEADTVLILIYTGMRVSEMLGLRKSDINKKQKYLHVKQSKTAAGIRIIPIHGRIWPLVQSRLVSPGAHLVADSAGRPYSYARYCTVWDAAMGRIGAVGHTTHDCRHTCATMLDNAEAKKHIILLSATNQGGNISSTSTSFPLAFPTAVLRMCKFHDGEGGDSYGVQNGYLRYADLTLSGFSVPKISGYYIVFGY